MGQILDKNAPIVPRLGGTNLRQELQSVLLDRARAVEHEEVELKIPDAHHLMQRHPAMHYHFHPEIFIQMHGTTRFQFPAGSMTLKQGEIGVLPTGLPHGEAVERAGHQFRNLVIGFYSSSVCMHFAVEVRPGKPDIEAIAIYPTPQCQHIIDLVEHLVRIRSSSSRQRKLAEHGMTLALLAILTDLVETETPEIDQHKQRIFQIKWLVRDQLFNPALNVRFVAEHFKCSADYLSHVFHRDAGETLIHYIQRQRMVGATEALANPALSISEIAWACGFADAGYFTRVFRKHFGIPPLAHRRRIQQAKYEVEARPKTIYSDREDFSPGKPARVDLPEPDMQ